MGILHGPSLAPQTPVRPHVTQATEAGFTNFKDTHKLAQLLQKKWTAAESLCAQFGSTADGPLLLDGSLEPTITIVHPWCRADVTPEVGTSQIARQRLVKELTVFVLKKGLFI
ncbi:MAG: hypothetical protein CMJ80_04580 [Planctomycetaceae bacterium]|nr:hypothetical protein [Planctomycetaceae bacterium]